MDIKCNQFSLNLGHVAMVKDEMMYVFGGQGAHSTLFNDTWMFDPSSNSWTELQVAVAPSPRLGHKVGNAPTQ